jgi:lipoprotein-anchoring transpeptidase ErfK/SrfK
MNIRKPIFRSASCLTAASAMLWFGAAAAAPLPNSYPPNSGAPFASVMEPPAEQSDIGNELAADLRRQVVDYPTPVEAGTVIIDTSQTYLYYVLGDGKAIRYGIGVGRVGFTWSGSQVVTRMAEWPDWTPPEEMITRQPYLPRWMAGGKGNPLGARAIYLGSTVYRIHGTNAPGTIGTQVSSGCIRMINADVIDLYRRVTVGSRIIVLPNRIHQVVRTATPVHLAAPRIVDRPATGIY